LVSKIRKQVYIEPEQAVLVKELAARAGLSESAIIREALSRYAAAVRRHDQRLQAWANLEVFIARRVEEQPAQSGRTWRREDLYDR
jgi:hypothetical protein